MGRPSSLNLGASMVSGQVAEQGFRGHPRRPAKGYLFQEVLSDPCAPPFLALTIGACNCPFPACPSAPNRAQGEGERPLLLFIEAGHK